jgi:hypothetical protein
MATAKNSTAKKTKKILTWQNIKNLIQAQCDEFDKMIFGICEDPNDFIQNKKWVTTRKEGPYMAYMELSFGTLEYDNDRELVILSYYSAEDPEVGYLVQKVYLNVKQISALRDFLLAAYFVKRGRRQIEK